jgi:hypothetical protein
MNKLLQYHIQVNATLETTFKQLRRQLLSWGETRALPELDARTQYDIGENDCRPQPAKLANDYSTSFEAMLNRAV